MGFLNHVASILIFFSPTWMPIFYFSSFQQSGNLAYIYFILPCHCNSDSGQFIAKFKGKNITQNN